MNSRRRGASPWYSKEYLVKSRSVWNGVQLEEDDEAYEDLAKGEEYQNVYVLMTFGFSDQFARA